MTDFEVSAEHRAMLEAHLSSFEKLEVLHAVRVAGRPISRDELVAAVRLDSDLVKEVLDELKHAGLVELDVTRKLASLGAFARESTCDSLMALYQSDRIAILSILSSIAVSRIRRLTASAFSDAFVLRRKKRDEDG